MSLLALVLLIIMLPQFALLTAKERPHIGCNGWFDKHGCCRTTPNTKEANKAHDKVHAEWIKKVKKLTK